MIDLDEVMRRPGTLVFEGLVTLTQDEQDVTLWARIYEDEPEALLSGPWNVHSGSLHPKYTLVVTSERPDLPEHERPTPMPRPPFIPDDGTWTPLTSSRPWTLRAEQQGGVVEAQARWHDGLEYHGATGELGCWVADLSLVPVRQTATS